MLEAGYMEAERMSHQRELLAPGAVHVWLISPGAPTARALLRRPNLLSSEEVARGKRFEAPDLRRRHLLGRVLLRVALSRYAALSPGEWRIGVTPAGRPLLLAPNVAGLSFSLSSTAGLVACAIARSPSLGVDVEATGAASLPDLQRLLTAGEVRSLRRLPPRLRRHRFYELWTLKEAYLKARGLGLGMPLRSFGFRLGERVAIVPAPALGAGEVWKFEVLRPTRIHRAAVAACIPHKAALHVQTRWWGT